MSIERAIMAWVTRVDMFIICAWKYILLAATLYVIMLIAWAISDSVIKSQRDTKRRD